MDPSGPGDVRLGTPTAPNATTLLLLGSGELGKELLLAAQRLGVETVAVDRYDGAPAMQVAHRSYTRDMTDPEQIREVVLETDPDVVVPEIEAIATDELERLEAEGYDVVPTARATQLTMDRQRIREVTAEAVGVPTSDYAFADDRDAYADAVESVGLPAVVKPTMSSSGKGQSVVRAETKSRPRGRPPARVAARTPVGSSSRSSSRSTSSVRC